MPDWDKEMLGVGYAPTKGEIDQAMGDNVIAVRDDLDRAESLYLFVTKSIANGYLASVGYTSDQITFLNLCVSNFYNLKRIAYGLITQGGLYNYMDSSEELAGVK